MCKRAVVVTALAAILPPCSAQARKGPARRPRAARPGPAIAAPSPVARPVARRPAPPLPDRYETWFEDSTLRLVLRHVGTSRTERWELAGLVREGPWPGSRTVLRDPDDLGQHWLRVLDRATGQEIYSRGFGTLFYEWQTTEEAEKAERAFGESLRIPFPKRPVTVELSSRDRKGRFQVVTRFEVDPNRDRIEVFRPDPAVRVEALHRAREPARALDVVFVPEGYPKAQEEKMLADARRFAWIFLHTEPFVRHKDEINLWLVVAFSREVGISEPLKGRRLDTILGFSFDALGSPRYLMAESDERLRKVAAHAPYDQLYVMVNTARYGGGGIYNLYSTFPVDNEYSEYVFIHEFGHTFAGLGDEYYSSPVATNDMYPPGVEPWEPNLTRWLGRKLKWKVAPGVPLPTPPAEKYAGVVGLFEGAGYTGKGMYRPALDCKMFSKAFQPFCPVCMAAVERRLSRYTR